MEFTLEQANDVISNAQNPNHGAFHSNANRDVVAAVNKAFETAYPGRMQLDGNIPNELNDALNDAMAKQVTGAGGATATDLQTAEVAKQNKLAAETELRREWGFEYDGNMAAAGKVFGDMFQSQEAAAQFLDGLDLHLNPSLQAEAMKFLLKLSRAKKK